SREIDYERGAFVEIERIERVEIGVKEIEELNGGVEGDRQEENREEVIKIKDIISNEYNLPYENINIIII
ncbi:MAG: hypothetical protein R3Y29_07750, partial [bacterium]